MECNKDEALRAKQIAESKMQIGDFVGARKFAMKAQKLFPEIENIVHIHTVCEVHCAAQNKLSGSEMDWYGILQTEQLADEATIKKQYRKLALLLHPDKNKFSGAEAAFKLIGEANRVLSDQAKRSLYDKKCRAFMRTAAPRPPRPPSHYANRDVFTKKYDANARNYQNNSESTSWSSHQQAAQQTFWTICYHCKTWYQYYKSILNASLRCQNCSRAFVARDLGVQDVPPGYNWTSFNNQKEHSRSEYMAKCTGVGEHSKGGKSKDGNVATGGEKVDAKTSKGRESQTSYAGKKRARQSVPDSRESCKTENNNGVKDANVQGSGAFKPTSKGKESQTSYAGNKRARQSVPNSRENCKTENINGVKDANVQGSDGDPSGVNAGVQPRRSSRQKQHVSYSETSHGDDFETPSKRPRQNGSSSTIDVEKREVPGTGGSSKNNHSASSAAEVGVQSGKERNKTSDLPEEKSFQKESKIEQSRVQREEPSKSRLGDANSKADHCSPMDSSSPSNPYVISCPDADFSDFEKDRTENCFAVNQFWAIYDTNDCMPRFYARVKKVLSPGFRLRITWLEADPENKGEIHWHGAKLPVGCGKFRVGGSQVTKDRVMFSHRMHCIKETGRMHYMVYPSKGETWAIFRDWDIGWSSKPENHFNYKFEYVEVLSDFAENVGIEVAYLGKVKGFVSLFQHTEYNGRSSFYVLPNELYRFSHKIPSFKMTGAERDGVPQGSFELDPAGLPVDFFKVNDTGDVKMGDGMLYTGAKSSCQKSSECKVEHVMVNESSREARRHGSNVVERASSILRRSPRGSNRTDMDNGQVNKSREDGGKDKGQKDLSQPEGTDESSRVVKTHKSNHIERASSVLRRSPRGPNRKNMENGQVKSQCMTREVGSKDFGPGDSIQPEATAAAAASQADERIKTPKKHEKNDCEERLNVRRSPRDLSKKKAQVDAGQCTTSEAGCERSNANKKLTDNSSQSLGSVRKPSTGDCRVSKASFNDTRGKSEEKFQCNQIWALYGDRDRMPDIYAQIKKIEFAPDFRLHVALLEPCSPPKGITRPVVCGTFMVKKAKTRILSHSAFSHQLRVEPVADNRYEIYPRKGEIWALYKDQNYESTCSNQGRADCHVVEVLEDSGKNIKVLVLMRQSDTKPIYKAPRVQRSKIGIIEVPRVHIYRFSHQIPALWHSGEDDIHLRGRWELDPSSIPGFIIQLD